MRIVSCVPNGLAVNAIVILGTILLACCTLDRTDESDAQIESGVRATDVIAGDSSGSQVAATLSGTQSGATSSVGLMNIDPDASTLPAESGKHGDQGCTLEHNEGVLDSAKAADLTDIAEQMSDLATRAVSRWDPGLWASVHPPVEHLSIAELYLSAMYVARVAVSYDVTDLRARLALTRLEWQVAGADPEAGIDRDHTLRARKHAVCALEFARAAGDSLAIWEMTDMLQVFDQLLR